jgi:hypothetical protein
MTMADNFLYILGAGASCQAVPLVKEFPDRLTEFANELNSFSIELQDKQQETFYQQARADFFKALSWLANEARHHASVDTLAKKFFLKGDRQSLQRLKAVLSSYLIVRQAKMPLDMRYDSFFASVLYRDDQRELQLPPNIRILTWNYDTQLEKAFYGFAENSGEVHAKIFTSDKIHRINGCCGKTPGGHWCKNFCSVWEARDDSEAMYHGIGLFREYFAAHNTPDADIRFAWEHETNVFLSNILQAIKETTIVVIIGYSFPYFNRDIDRKIFGAMPKLQRVYIQYPEGVHVSIKERVQAMWHRMPPNAIQPVTIDENQFYIPDEYSGPA